MKDFSQSVAVVTGAASGLGAAVCRRLSQEGATVVAVDIQQQPPAELLDHVQGHYLCVDVSDMVAWSEVAERVNTLGGLDYLHLNAGIQIAPPKAPLDEYRFLNMQLDRYRTMMGVNVDGVVFGLYTLLPLLRNGGSVVVTSSLAGVTPYEVDPLYSMSKHAVSGLVRSLASECAARELTINALCPGGIDTNIIPEAQRSPAAQFMTPEHVASEVLMLMETLENGKTWAKVSEQKPAWIIRAPGDRGT